MDSKDIWEDTVDFDRTEICPFSDYDTEEAKERASILWLLSKAYDGVIPSELREPFYRDHEHHRRLKPKIVHSLANAELYCVALANIYSDPNYHNLDHHCVIQALTRKGICLMETADSPLTETVLVQTAPIKLAAHLAVIEGMISLYIKEVLIPEKVVDVIRSFSHVNINAEMPCNSEEAAVLWINKCCNTLEQEIKEEFETQETVGKLPRIPVLQEISDISDGCSLAAVICFYCPNYMNWQDACWNNPMSLGDSIYNLQLIKRFCCDNLPRQIDFLTLEDFLYVHPTIKDNVLVFVAELLFSFVILPASCVTRHPFHELQETSPSQSEGKPRSNSIPSHKAHQISYSAIPNLRADSYGGSSSSLPELRPGTSQGGKEPSDKTNLSRKSNLPSERFRMSPKLHRTNSSGVVNGYKSSNTSLTDLADNELRLSSSNMRRDILHSTVPNDNSNKADGVSHSNESRLSTGLEVYYHSLATNDGPIRSGSLSNIRENNAWRKSANERPSLKSSSSSQSSGICVSETDKQLSTTSFAKLSKEPETKTHGINIVYMQHEKDSATGDSKSLKKNFLQKGKPEKRATFAALPNTTTWQQQRILSSNSSQTDSGHETPVEPTDPSLNIQLANLRMKLEEKRRRIELEKKRMEALWKRERQKLGKVAFLQAVSRGSGGDAETPDSGTGKDVEEMEPPIIEKTFEAVTSSPSLVRRMSIQEIAEDLDSVQKKWLQSNETAGSHQSIPAGTSNGHLTDDFEASIEQLNSSLCDLQADISRITIQQEHVENLLQDSVEDASHFFLHNEPPARQLQESPFKTYKWNRSHYSSYPVQPPTNQQLSNELSPISLSPQKQSYHTQGYVQRQGSHEESTPATPKQEPPNVNLEELYSKVIKPSNRPKAKVSSQYNSLPGEPGSEKDIRHVQQSCELPSRTDNQALRQNSQEYSPRRNQPEHSYHPSRDSSPQKKSLLEEDQVFHMSFDDQPKKSTTKWQRPTSDIKNVQQDLPNKDTPDHNSFGFVIGADLVHPDPVSSYMETEIEMAKKKEMIMNLSIRRRADHENRRLMKEQEYARLKDEEQRKRELLEKKREEERQRRQAILEQYRQRKMLQEELEKEGMKDLSAASRSQTSGIAKSRSRVSGKPRPKSSFISSGDAPSSIDSSVVNKRNSQFITTGKDGLEFDMDSLNSTGTSASSRDRTHSPTNGHMSSCQVSPSQHSGDSVPRPPESGGKSSDGASDTTSNSSNAAVMMEYTGPKLFVKPTAKSNRGIIINAVNTVLAGAVNAETKKKVVEEINKSESKHFLILFRDAGCQFRAIYSYNPDTDEVIKLYGIGPKSVADKVMEKFYKYNSGGKCFSEVQTKHLTVTIDAFTIPNSLWAGKKIVPPRKEFF